jgi:hypothetical protein
MVWDIVEFVLWNVLIERYVVVARVPSLFNLGVFFNTRRLT